MPPQTPKQKLIEAVRKRFVDEGFHRPTAYPMAVLAVEAFYAENQESEFYHIVAQEALNLITEAIPPFVTHMRAAFESMQAAMNHVTESARVAGPWADLAMRLDQERKRRPTKFDASGLPVEEGTMADVPSVPADRQAEPCIEEGCGADAVPGTAFCADCMPTPSAETQLMAVVRDHITGDTTEHPVPASVLHFGAFRGVEFSRDQGETWESLPGILSIEVNPPSNDSPIEVFEMTEREVHLAAARTLRKLGCTYGELKAMHDRGDFESAHHHSAWFNFGNLINLEQLDRANFVLQGLEDENGEPALVSLEDHDIARLERDYPTDRITGAPHHYIINGDHTACGCNGHDPSCEVWDVPFWHHKPTLCRISRTLCIHTPKHTYGQACGEYHENLAELVRPPVVGQTTEGEDVRGPAAG